MQTQLILGIKLVNLKVGYCIMKNYMFFCLVVCLFFPQISFARNYSGAIYVDETTGIAGSAWDFDNDVDSKKAALNSCKIKSGKKYCELISGWGNSCSAVAWSPKNKSARTGKLNDNQKEAEKLALEACRRAERDPRCKLVASVCTNWETEEVIWW